MIAPHRPALTVLATGALRLTLAGRGGSEDAGSAATESDRTVTVHSGRSESLAMITESGLVP